MAAGFLCVARSLKVRLLAAIATVALVTISGAPSASADSSGSSQPGSVGYKSAHDTDPHLALTSAQQQMLSQKRQAEVARLGPYTINRSTYSINVVQQPQGTTSTNKYYYCGPASLDEAATYKGRGMGQDNAASMLKTNSDGTAWSGVWIGMGNNTGFPMPDALNYQIGLGGYYVPVYVAYPPSPSAISGFEADLKYDIDNLYPVVGDAYEAPGYPYLWGHPTNEVIGHWFTMYGYSNYGANTGYVDSATSVWTSVSAYNWGFDSATLMTIISERGYVW